MASVLKGFVIAMMDSFSNGSQRTRTDSIDFIMGSVRVLGFLDDKNCAVDCTVLAAKSAATPTPYRKKVNTA